MKGNHIVGVREIDDLGEPGVHFLSDPQKVTDRSGPHPFRSRERNQTCWNTIFHIRSQGYVLLKTDSDVTRSEGRERTGLEANICERMFRSRGSNSVRGVTHTCPANEPFF